MTKIKSIHIYHDKKSLISDWAIFLMGAFIVVLFGITYVRLIETWEGESQLLALMIFTYAFVNLTRWVKFPTRCHTREVIHDE